MRRNPAIAIGLLLAIAVGMAWCFSLMIGRRFAGGEVYPAGSTQRSDPVGAKALYEAVDRLASTTCDRNFKALHKLEGAKGDTLVFLNVHPISFYDAGDGPTTEGIDGDAVLHFAAGGGRVIVALQGERDVSSKIWEGYLERNREIEEKRFGKKKEGDDSGKDKEDKDQEKKRREAKKKLGDDEDKVDLPFKPVRSLRKALQIGAEPNTLPSVPENGHDLETPEGLAALHGKLPGWLTQVSLDLNPKPEDDDEEEAGSKKTGDDKVKQDVKDKSVPKVAWQVLATVSKKPVLIEGRFGAGSIVVATDSYYAMNQALLMHPVPEFLAWLMGDARRVIFDETHLGTQEDPGIMAMARRYRLHGFFLGGVLLFALFVWQSSSSLVPARDDFDPGMRAIAGQGAVAGLVSLLRRGVSRSRLLQTCFDQWARSHPHPRAALKTRIEHARALLPPDGKRPARGTLVALYQRLCETLHPNRH